MMFAICQLFSFTLDQLIFGESLLSEMNLMLVSEAFGMLITFLRDCDIPHNFTTQAIPESYDVKLIVDMLGYVSILT